MCIFVIDLFLICIFVIDLFWKQWNNISHSVVRNFTFVILLGCFNLFGLLSELSSAPSFIISLNLSHPRNWTISLITISYRISWVELPNSTIDHSLMDVSP